jgi:hypothetical protein
MAHFCSECGAEFQEGIHFCTECGHPVSVSEPVPQPVVAGAHGGTPVFGPQAMPVAAQPAVVAAPVAATQTVTMRTLGAWLMRRKWPVILALALLFALVGAVAGFALPQGEVGEIVADLPVGPEGASVKFDEGKGTLKVPKGAVDEPERIIIRRTIIRERVRANVPGGIPIILPPGTVAVYIFGPATLVFNRPVTIVLPLPNPGVPGIIFVFQNGQIRFLGGTINAAGTTIRITTTNFAFATFGVN